MSGPWTPWQWAICEKINEIRDGGVYGSAHPALIHDVRVDGMVITVYLNDHTMYELDASWLIERALRMVLGLEETR